MNIWSEVIINFCFSFLLSELVINVLQIISLKIYLKDLQKKKKSKKKEQEKKSIEDIIIEKYHIDLNIIGYKNFITCMNLTNSTIIATAFTVLMEIKNYYLGLLIGGIIIIAMILSLYTIIGRYYERKCINYGYKNDRK